MSYIKTYSVADNEDKFYKQNVEMTMQIKFYLEDKFEKAFNFVRCSNEEWEMFHQHYEKGEPLRFLKKIAEGYTDKQIIFLDKNNTKVSESFDNAIYYYDEYEVAVACVPNFTNNGVRNLEYVFYADEAKYLAFSKAADDFFVRMDDKEIIVYTDTIKGVVNSRQAISNMIDREHVVLEKEIKDAIYSSIDEFFAENQEFYRKYNIPHKRGIMLYGEPGNGKTTLVKSLVGTINSPVVYWQVNEFTNSSSMKEVFDAASNIAPVVLVIEDLDSLPSSTRSTFLNTLDGATTKEGIFLIGTTNYPDRVDKALINRVGRFDRTYEIKLPNAELRLEYLQVRGMGDFISEEKMNEIVAYTESYSFVQLSEIFRKVASDVYKGEEPNITETIDALSENNRKSAKNEWSTAKSKRVGF